MRLLAAAGLALAASIALAASPVKASQSMEPEPASIRANGVELHHVRRGSGVPVVFVHGGLGDYRELGPVAQALPDGFATLTYSRRHSFPNTNPRPGPDHSMMDEVEDLAALIEALGLAPVHLVGTSYGAFTSLMLALRRPDLVRSVTAAEPPILHWLPDIEGGQEVYDHFHSAVMRPSSEAFSAGDPEEALAVAVRYFAGPDGMEQLPAEFRAMLLANIEDWRAITASSQVFPPVNRDEIAGISVPVLLISGGKTAPVHRLVDPELHRAIPGSKRIVIAGGSHDMCSEQPGACAKAIADFIAGQAGGRSSAAE